MRLLAVDDSDKGEVWHVAVYEDFFPDVDCAEAAISAGTPFSVSSPHLALTTRAFESTQVAKIANVPLTADELNSLDAWRDDPERKVSNRSVRLLLGVR